MKGNIATLLSKVFISYEIPVTYSTLEKVVHTHPAYPSMQSVSDALSIEFL
jgi:hypothetical protein